MAPVRSAYAGGYSEAIKRRLESVVIPEKVKCETCKRIRMQAAFSKRQLENLRNAIVVQGANAINGPGYAKCRNCVGGQAFEMKCTVCDQVKGLESFAKAQRQNREMARCIDCVQAHTEADPVLDEEKLLGDEEEPSTMSQMGEESTTENLRFNRSLRNLPTNSAYDADGGGGGEEDDSVGGGVWLEVNRSDERSIGKEMSRVPTGYGDQGAGTPHGASISQSENRSAHTGWGSWGVVPVTRNTVNSASTKPGPKKKESKFAKVPAYKPSTNRQASVMPRMPEPATEAIPSDEEDANESIEEYL